ncbi:glycosyltransferase [Aeromonas veronii]|uniref:glycosyltransferase family 2 protein n=1 Tax=Aeromonas TaxID=642 RepID=UPI0021CEA9D1|nr:glycosyltransferase family 2 protein [Aeromonas caviae]MCU7794247.1 glycosyltransferase [Aeromonas caviae]
MHVNKVSLIGTSQGGREVEVERLLQSLIGTNSFLEVVFVDQSNDDKISEIVKKYEKEVSFVLLKSLPISLSKARNIALKHCSGNIIGFCDDDAFYDLATLKYLHQYDIKKRAEILSSKVIDKKSNSSYAGRSFPNKEVIYNRRDILKYCLSVSTFIIAADNSWIKENVHFDERLGVGAELGGSEESELILRLVSDDVTVKFIPFMIVYHDNDLTFDNSDIHDLAIKYYKYAVGYGAVIRRFYLQSRFLFTCELLIVSFRCIVGMFLDKKRKMYLYRLFGLWLGFLGKKL